MNIAEPTTIGLSEGAHKKLKWLQKEQHFRELLDGYRFAIGLALAQGVEPPEVQKRTTIFNVGTVDPDQSLNSPLKKALLTGFHSTAKHNATKAVSPSSETMRTI